MAKYRSEISSFQYGDHLAQNRRHRLIQRLNIKKIAKFESDASKLGEHTTRQNRELFIGGRRGGGGGVAQGVQVSDGCKILRLSRAIYSFCFQQLSFRHDSYYFF